MFFCFVYSQVYIQVQRTTEKKIAQYKLLSTCFSAGAEFSLSVMLSGIYTFSLNFLMGKWLLVLRPCM